MDDHKFVIKYVIKGREDGRWVIRAYDRHNHALSVAIWVDTPSECWKIFMLLNGYSDAEPTEIIERMEKVS